MKAFVDTNVLVYAHDRAAGSKHERARRLVEELWNEGAGSLSVQVLQELYVNVRRKSISPISDEEAKQLVESYLAWSPVVNDGSAVLSAIVLGQRHQLSFWDALVVVAANRAGASILYTEDLNDGQRFGELRIVNPFAASWRGLAADSRNYS